MNCDKCDYFFNDMDSFNIHLNKCSSNINDDPKNKYYCPSCDKKFRTLTNLEKHNESKKHINLFEWNKKQLNINQNTSTTKTIHLISDIEQEQEPEPEHEHKPTPQQESMDTLVAKLIQERELQFQSYQPQPTPRTQPTQQNRLDTLIDEDDNDLSEELKQTKMSLNMSHDIHQKEIEKVEKQSSDDDFLNDIQEQRNQQLIQPPPIVETPQKQVQIIKNPHKPTQPTQPQKPTQPTQPQKPIQPTQPSQPQQPTQPIKPRYNPEFKNTPIWKQLSSLVNNTNTENETAISNKIITFLSKSSLNTYPHICTYILYSEDLDNKPELKNKLKKGLNELKKALAKLISLRTPFWNGVSVAHAYAFMNKLEL
jgi:hypothetical protein